MGTLRVFLQREGAQLPRYETDQAAGLDLCACVEASITIDPGRTAKIPTGIAIALPAGHEGQVRPRSGLAAKHGVTVLNAPGTIDADYRGEVQVLLINHGQEPFTVDHGARIAQLIVAPVTQVAVQRVNTKAALGTTVRGADGFGSTGQ